MAASPSPGSSAMTGHDTFSPIPTTTTARSWAAGARYPPEIVLPAGQSASASRPASFRSPSAVDTTRSFGHFSPTATPATVATASAIATAAAIDTVPATPAGGRSSTDTSNDPRGGATQCRSRRPRPADW